MILFSEEPEHYHVCERSGCQQKTDSTRYLHYYVCDAPFRYVTLSFCKYSDSTCSNSVSLLFSILNVKLIFVNLEPRPALVHSSNLNTPCASFFNMTIPND